MLRRETMSEDERLKLLETVLDAHASLADAALELRRRFSRQSPLTKTAVKAEKEAFRLKRELQRFDLSDPIPPLQGGPLSGVRQGQQMIDFERLRR